MQRDLRPYVCTYSGCKEADQQYDSFKQWVTHEVQAHGAGQPPPERPTNEYSFQDSTQAQREAQHTGNLDPSSQDSRQCPICLETPASFDHIGLHLWNIAMFSLPRSTGIEEESDQGSTGSAVNDKQSQDSRLTNMKDLESLSIEGEQDENATASADDRENHETAHLTIEALKDVPDSLRNGVAVNVCNYILSTQTTGDEEETLEIDHGSRSDSGSDLGIIPIEEGSIREIEETLNRYKDTLGPEHMSTLDAIAVLADAYETENQFVKAGTLYQRALSGYEKVLGPENVKTVAVVRDLGFIYFRQRRYPAAERLLQRALQSYVRILGPDDIEISRTVVDLGRVYQDQNRFTEAEGLFQRALKGYEKKLGIEHPHTMDRVQNLGSVYQLQGKLTEAESLFQLALRTDEKILGVEHPKTLSVVRNLGSVYELQDRLTEAESLFQRALQGYDKVFGPEHPRIIKTVWELGYVYQVQNKLTEAEGLYQRALKTLTTLKDFEMQNFKEDWTLTIATTLGDLYKEQGRLVEAEEMYQRARENEKLNKARDTGLYDGFDEDGDSRLRRMHEWRVSK